MERKDAQYCLRLSNGERDRLEQLARALGVSLAAAMRMVLHRGIEVVARMLPVSERP
jgi:predicted DNA-binding protein